MKSDRYQAYSGWPSWGITMSKRRDPSMPFIVFNLYLILYLFVSMSGEDVQS
jgi:hypothetical protein